MFAAVAKVSRHPRGRGDLLVYWIPSFADLDQHGEDVGCQGFGGVCEDGDVYETGSAIGLSPGRLYLGGVLESPTDLGGGMTGFDGDGFILVLGR
ncbi:MAG: hypothetical protein JRH20_32030 [Deltaproteobacteria bacterium]|nr:hypothetical protein [Deltaproteobacteria bacterium]